MSFTMRLLIDLPWPDKGLSPNARLHHIQKSILLKKARADAYLLTMQQLRSDPRMLGHDGPIAVLLECYPPDARAYDADGLLSRCKAGLDGIADALRVNDRQFNPITIHRMSRGSPAAVMVTLSASRQDAPA